MAVSVEELAGSPKIEFNRRGGSASRSVKMAWADRYAFLLQVLPSASLSGTDVVIPPTEAFPGVNFLFVDRVNIEPMFPDDPIGDGVFPAAYTHARADIDYATFDYETQDTGSVADGPGGSQGLGPGQQKTFVSIDVNYSGQYLTWPNPALKWDEASDENDDEKGKKKVPEDVKVSVVTPTIEYNVTWHFVPFPPWFAMRLATGAVNAYEFLGAPPETLMFLGAKAKREITNSGARAWSLSYKFVEKNNNPFDATDPYGWNHFLRTDGPKQGAFMRLNRRIIGGETRMRLKSFAIDPTINIRNNDTFPRDNSTQFLHLICERTEEIMKVLTAAPQSTKEWTVARAQKGTLADDLDIDDVLRQTYAVQLPVGIDATSTLLAIDNENSLPSMGQFFLKIMDGNDSETVLVARRFPGTNTLGILRGLRGQVAKAHGAGVYAEAVNMPVYPLWNFSTLFLSGLVTG